MNACPMIIRCYYHQHPEDYGRGYVDEPCLPEIVRYGRDAMPASTAMLPEEIMGHPEARAGG